MHVPHRFYDMFEEQEQWTPYAFPGVHQYHGAPACAISTFTAYCSLALIMVSVAKKKLIDRDKSSHTSMPRRHRRKTPAFTFNSYQIAWISGAGIYLQRSNTIPIRLRRFPLLMSCLYSKSAADGADGQPCILDCRHPTSSALR